ncbi:MAG: 30S ribosomal protein S6 [Thermodesulfobacteriota bacterium]
MNYYETILILRADLSDERIKENVQQFRDLIEKANGTILNYEDWGKKKLAYVVKKQGRGSYHLYQFSAAATILAEMDSTLKLKEDVLRFMTIRIKEPPKSPQVKEEDEQPAPTPAQEE